MIKRLLVVAGSGTYPELVVRGAKKAGVPIVDIVAIRGSTSRVTVKAADSVHWTPLCKFSECIRWMGEQGYDGTIMAGQLNPLSIFRGGLDAELRAELAALPVKNAHSIFKRLVDILAEHNVTVLPASLFMDGNLPGVGTLTSRVLTESEQSDITHAMAVVRDMGLHDVGQTVMVKSGMVLAVEAFEGTNAAIRRGGRLGGKGAVLFKAAREGHDMRFDIPVVGLKTLKMMKKAGATALGFQAGRLILLDREAVIAFANRHNIAIVGVDSGLPPAPLRP